MKTCATRLSIPLTKLEASSGLVFYRPAVGLEIRAGSSAASVSETGFLLGMLKDISHFSHLFAGGDDFCAFEGLLRIELQ